MLFQLYRSPNDWYIHWQVYDATDCTGDCLLVCFVLKFERVHLCVQGQVCASVSVGSLRGHECDLGQLQLELQAEDVGNQIQVHYKYSIASQLLQQAFSHGTDVCNPKCGIGTGVEKCFIIFISGWVGLWDSGRIAGSQVPCVH